MYKVKVINPCSCFVKNGFVDMQDFDTKEEAKTQADYLLHKMQTSFCAKHEFGMSEQFGTYTILVKPRR